MAKMKINIRKPQYLASKEKENKPGPIPKMSVGVEPEPEQGLSFFDGLLLLICYGCCGLVGWYVYQAVQG